MRRVIFIFRAAVAAAVAAVTGTAAAYDCKAPRSRIETTICMPGDLRKQVEEFEAAFADALKRAPDRVSDLKTTEKIWQEALESGCVARRPDVLKRCIESQLKIRTKELAILVPKPGIEEPEQTVSAANIPPSTSPGLAVRPGSYVSDAVVLRLSDAGEYEMKALSGGREANGHYTFKGDVLTLIDGAGDVGTTKFPLICHVLQIASGFAIKLGQPQCRQLDGISFRFAS